MRVEFLFIIKKADFAVCLFYDSFYINRSNIFTYHVVIYVMITQKDTGVDETFLFVACK